jgi:glycosyltransferase involved in cell wall biosynthesis
MKFSIIIPTYNEKANLLDLKKFIANLNYPKDGLEFIVSDTYKSNENAEDLGEPYTILISEKCNRACQMNFGAKKAKGDVLIFLHADVRPPTSFLEDITLAINYGFEFGFFAYNFIPSSFMLSINASFTSKKGFFAGGGDQIHFFKKELFNKLGGYNEGWHIMEDFEMMNKIKKAKIPYTIIQNKANVSSRKYKSNSWPRVKIANLIAMIMFKLRYDSIQIKKVYNAVLK